MKIQNVLAATLLAFTLSVPRMSAWAADMPATVDMNELQKMVTGMAKQMEQMRQLLESQNKKIEYLEQRTIDAVKIPQSAAGITSPVVPSNEKEFRDALTKELGSNYPYFKNLKMGGDFRLRWESFSEENDLVQTGQSGTTNTTSTNLNDRNRFRYRLRYGLENKLDDVTVGFRLVSATLASRDGTANTSNAVYASDPTSTNQTMGSPGLFSFNTIAIDKAFAKYEPKLLKDVPLGSTTLEKFEVGGGKFENPHMKYSSPMVWDSDVTPEGLYEKFDWNLYKNKNTELNIFGFSMQSPLLESTNGDQDASLFTFAGGFNVKGQTPLSENPAEWTSAVHAYLYRHFADSAGATANYMLGGGTSLARGNTTCVGTAGAGPCTGMESGDPRILEFYNEVKLNPIADIPLKLFNDVAANVNNGAVSGTSAHKSTAWGIGTTLGQLKNPRDWQLSYGFYSMPPNAVVSAFNDADFGQGYSNNVGSMVRAGYQLTKSLQLNLGWFHFSPYSGDVAAQRDVTTNRFQTDLAWKF